DQIRPWRHQLGLPLIISEIGYRSADGSVTRPWNYFLPGDVDMEEQRRGYEAFFRAWYDDDMLQGVYFYNWFGEGGPDDKNYTPRGKPAATVMQSWYAKIAERDIKRAAERAAHPDPTPPAPLTNENRPVDPDPPIGPALPPDWPHGSPGTDSLEPRGLPSLLVPEEFRSSPTLAVRFRGHESWSEVGTRITTPIIEAGKPQKWEIVLIDPVDRMVIVRDASRMQTITLRGD
ncbi:MAG: hypothetical protein AB7K09_20625, partial [Planctomycetota bacterium]